MVVMYIRYYWNTLRLIQNENMVEGYSGYQYYSNENNHYKESLLNIADSYSTITTERKIFSTYSCDISLICIRSFSSINYKTFEFIE